MSTNNDQAKAAWLAKVEQYPSLKKFVEAGDGYVSVCQSIASLYFKSHSRVSSHDGREQNLLSFIKAHPNFETMQGNPTLVLQAMDEFAYQHDFLINIGEHKGKIVTDLIAKVKPKVLVELGGYVGYSAILFADQMRKQAATASDIHIYLEPGVRCQLCCHCFGAHQACRLE